MMMGMVTRIMLMMVGSDVDDLVDGNGKGMTDDDGAMVTRM